MRPVVLCIGSEKISGDSLGPVVGTVLKERFCLDAFVYGAEGSAVQAKNLTETLKFIETVHEGQIVLAVDACLGKNEDIGTIKIRRGGVNAGRATKKNLPPAGDLSVLGIVGENCDTPMQELLTVSALFVQEMAYKIAFLIVDALEE